MVLSALHALTRLDREQATVFAKITYDSLRGPMQAALEALVMERQTQDEAKCPPFMERVFEQGERKGGNAVQTISGSARRFAGVER
jgi:hypothetical protein